MELLKRANGNIPRTQQELDTMLKEMTEAYGQFLTAAGFDWKADENSSNTPHRVAKAWLQDIINGCVSEQPNITAFPNDDNYTGMVFQGNIPVISLCSHHNLQFTGLAHVAYLPGERVIGLSKINRTVDWFSRRPQIQEGLTSQIHKYIDEICVGNKGVAVVVEANHSCVKCRGIKNDSTMGTALMSGAFLDNNDRSRDEFYTFVSNLKK